MNYKNILVLLIVVAALLLSGCVTKQAYQVAYQEPYQVAYESPVYTTFISGTLTDTGLKANRFNYANYISLTKEYTGKDFWGDATYTVTLCKSSGCVTCQEINVITQTSENIQTGTETKYRTEYRTAYRTEYR